MNRQNNAASRLANFKEQPYRSFKLRYLMYSLPIMLFISGLLTVVLTGFANMHLEQQYRQQIGNMLSQSSEELRMIILSRNIADLQEFLKRVAVKLDSLSMVLQNSDKQQVAAYSERKNDESSYSIEYTHILLMQNIAGHAEEWRLIARLKPSPLTNLIDSFLLYQLLIISVMILGAMISTFIAFEKSVGKPVQIIKSALLKSLDGHHSCGDLIVENDEFGELATLLGEHIHKCHADARKFEEFGRLTGKIYFDFDLQEEVFQFSGDPGEMIGLPEGSVRCLGDLWANVSSDQRGEAKQSWFDVKESMVLEEAGKHSMELRLSAIRDEQSLPGNENWVKVVFLWGRADGKPSVSGYIASISAEKKRELEFNLQTERYRKTYENLPLGIWRSQGDRFVYMNQAMADILGYSDPSEAIDKVKSINHDLYVSAVDRTFFLDELKKRDQVKNLEMKFKRSNGEVFWGALFGRLYQERSVHYVEGGFVDITQRKQAEDRLRADEEFLRQSMEIAGIVSWQIDPVNGQILFKGPVSSLLGQNANTIDTVKGFSRLVHSDDLQRFLDSIERGRRIENVGVRERNRVEFRICRLGQDQKTEIRWLQSFYALSEAGSTNRSGVLRGMFFDISSLKESEEKLKLAINKEKLDSHDRLQFFANMSHDIRTPLNAIIGFSELLSPVLTEGKGEHYVSSILGASRSLIGVIDNILDLSRLEAGRVELLPEPLRFTDLAEDIRQLFVADADKKQLNLSVTVEPDVPDVLMLDEARIRQVLVSLVGNAIKFTSRGMVALKVALAHSEHKGLVNLVITVEDSGIGIPEDDLLEIFDPFSSKRGKSNRLGSAGVGLAICDRLISLMNGSIKVKSDLERGTRFEILLKEVSAIEGGLKSRTTQLKLPRKICFLGQKVLVADDTSSNRELLSEALGNIGLKVVCAADGNEAVAVATSEKPDLIFMDIRMPEKDGICAARELKCLADTAKIPIVAVTASVSFTEEEKLKGLFDGFLNKPISLARLFAEAARFLRHDYSEGKVPISNGSLLPPEAFEQLHEPWELCAAINSTFLPLLGELEGAVVINKARSLAEILKQISVKHSFNYLTLEAEKLIGSADTFDIAGIRECCLRIRRIMEQLLKVYSRGPL